MFPPALQGAVRLIVGGVGLLLSSLAVADAASDPSLSGGWILRYQRPGGVLWSIASNGTRLVTVGSGGRILTSDDGVIWNARASGVSDWLVGVSTGAGRCLAVGDHGCILTSPDGAA
jgi:hypothetical protein